MAARALILANGVFADPDIPPLKSPVPDGARLKALLERADVKPYEVSHGLDLTNQTAREVIADFCQSASTGDQLLLFISGHGIKDQHGKLFFATADTRKLRLKATALEARYVLECMQESAAERQLLFLDTCYSGAFARGATFKSAATPITADDFEGDWSGRAILSASTAVQLAGEAEADGFVQSRFTRALIDGIASGRADISRHGQITLDDLYTHIQIALKGTGQTPQLFGEKIVGKIVVAHNPALIRLPEDIHALLADRDPWQRGVAVDRLAALVRSGPTVLAGLAVDRLRERAQIDDSSLVRVAAKQALVDLEPAENSPPETSHKQERVTKPFLFALPGNNFVIWCKLYRKQISVLALFILFGGGAVAAFLPKIIEALITPPHESTVAGPDAVAESIIAPKSDTATLPPTPSSGAALEDTSAIKPQPRTSKPAELRDGNLRFYTSDIDDTSNSSLSQSVAPFIVPKTVQWETSFDYNSSLISIRTTSILEEVYRNWQSNQQYIINIRAFHDTALKGLQGNTRSGERCKAVRDYLIDKGVPSASIEFSSSEFDQHPNPAQIRHIQIYLSERPQPSAAAIGAPRGPLPGGPSVRFSC